MTGPLGIVDWGIGGMGVLRAVLASRPRASLLYFSDAGFTPYGKVPRRELRARLSRVASWLAARGVSRAVVACHSASTVLPPGTFVRLGHLEVTGVVAHAIALVRDDGARRVGVVGGARTIRSRVYPNALASARRQVVQRIAQPLSAWIEAGVLDSAGVREDVARIVRPIADADALLLACTHYPALAPLFAQHTRARLLDPAEAMARHVVARWSLDSTPAGPIFVTTGEPDAMRTSARKAFGVSTARVERVRL